MSKVDLTIVLDQFKIIRIEEIIESEEFLWEESVRGEIVAELLLVHAPHILYYSLLLSCMNSQHLHIQSIILLVLLGILLCEG